MQLVKTKHHGELRVLESYQVEGMHIAKTEAGYVHMTGLPINNKEELTRCLPPAKHKEALDWWFKRFEQAEKAPRCIMVDPTGRLFFEDGTAVSSADEIDASIEPGPAREAMRQAFYIQKAKEQEEMNRLSRPQAKAKPAAPPRRAPAKKKRPAPLARVEEEMQGQAET